MNDTHGTSGPIKVSYAPNSYNIAENFLEVAQAIDKARPLTQDMNDFSTTDRYGVRESRCSQLSQNIHPLLTISAY